MDNLPEKEWKYTVSYERTATAKGTIGFKVTAHSNDLTEANDHAILLKQQAETEAGERKE